MVAERSTWRAVHPVLVAAAIAWSPVVVRAQQPRVYVVAVPMSESAAVAAGRAASGGRAALGSIEGIEWRTADQTYVGYDDSVVESLTRARERFQTGKTAFQEVDLDRAIEELTGAVADFDAAAAALDDSSEIGTALLYLGAAHDVAGHSRDAARIFARIHVQLPGLAPDADTFNPDVVAHFDAARPRDRSESGTIRVESDPVGGLAVVDFSSRGATPASVGSLRNGTHVVRVTRPGSAPYVQPVEVRRGATASVNAMLVESEEATGLADAVGALPQTDMEAMGRNTPLTETARLLGLNKLGVLRVSDAGGGQTGLELLVFDVASGRRLLRAQGTTSSERGQIERASRALVAQGMSRALNVRATGGAVAGGGGHGNGFIPEVGGPRHDEGGGGSVLGKWWFWAGVGAIVVVGVVIGVVLASGGNDLATDQAGQVVLEF